MDITIIIPPGPGGVCDFVDNLSNNLSTKHKVTKLEWEKESKDTILEQILITECVYLQYSGYGYAKRGAPFWLLNQILKHRKQIKHFGVFFHELYAFAPPWSSAFWLSPSQRHIAKRLAELSDFWLTNRETSAVWLKQFAKNKPYAVLPVISNVGELTTYHQYRAPKVVIFGGSELRYKTYIAAGDALFTWAKLQHLEIHDIGPKIIDKNLSEKLTENSVAIHGRLPEANISQLLSNTMFGLMAYPLEYIAKSGVLAAFCAHGVCPILISKSYPPTSVDGLLPNQHFLTGVPKSVCIPSIAAEIGQASWLWYQTHRLETHIEIFNDILTKAQH
ncbi:MAG: hypothetical protein WC782_03985 [Methylococcaceae bacterium]|jgi:hypothetical protein